MTGYRVATEASDPLSIEAGLVAQQRRQQMVLLHAAITVLSVGLWLPVLIWRLATMDAASSRFAHDYRIDLSRGMLSHGTPTDSRAIPLDAIAGVASRHGVVTVTARGVQPMNLIGLKDPMAACRAILDAREAHLRGLRGDVGADEFGSEVASRRESAGEGRS